MTEKSWTIGDVLNWTTSKFKQCDLPTPLLDAQLLLCQVLKTQKINLYLDYEKPLTVLERKSFRDLVTRRLNGEPVAYILNEKYWYNLNLYVDKNVLIPRPETECLVDFVKDVFLHQKENPKIIFDFCTGSGCLALALAQLYPESTVVGIDVSSQALEIAKKNALKNNISNCEWLLLDLTKSDSYSFLKNKLNVAQVIVANPPYVTEKEWFGLDISVKNYEPKIALTAEDEGLYIAHQILKNCQEFSLLEKEKCGFFAMEMSEGQPQKLISTKICSLPSILSLQKNNLEEWFSICDFDLKYRFLCKVTGEYTCLSGHEVIEVQETN